MAPSLGFGLTPQTVLMASWICPNSAVAPMRSVTTPSTVAITPPEPGRSAFSSITAMASAACGPICSRIWETRSAWIVALWLPQKNPTTETTSTSSGASEKIV